MDEVLETTETLGELRHELNCIVEAEQRQRQEADAADRRYQEELSPVLYRLRDYLHQLIKLLNDKRLQQSEKTRHLCMPEVNYDLSYIGVRAFGSLQGRQIEYQMITSNQVGRLADFCLIYQCVPETRVAIQHVEFRKLHDCSLRTSLQDRLREHGLQYECVERPCHDGDIKMLFTLQPIVTVKFEFNGNADGKSFQLRITNAGGEGNQGVLGTLLFPCITPQQVGVEAIEALIQSIIRQPNKLHHYWQAELSEQHTAMADLTLPQTYDFEGVKAVDMLARIRNSQVATKKSAAKTAQSEQLKKLDKVQESLEEYTKRAEQEHLQYMAELEKIRLAIENGQAENRTLLSWATALLFSKRKRSELS
jgi:hypothetical protein